MENIYMDHVGVTCMLALTAITHSIPFLACEFLIFHENEQLGWMYHTSPTLQIISSGARSVRAWLYVSQHLCGSNSQKVQQNREK